MPGCPSWAFPPKPWAGFRPRPFSLPVHHETPDATHRAAEDTPSARALKGIDTVENPASTSRLPLELKAFYRDLVTACGGPKRAAEIVGAQASHMSEAMGAHNLDRWPRLDHVAMLEIECGQPIVTAALADRSGYSLNSETASDTHTSPLAHLHRIVSEVRDVECGILHAMQDGHLTAAERRDIRRQVQEAIAALNALCADLLDTSTAPRVVKPGA
jgi:hypothetical protein